VQSLPIAQFWEDCRAAGLAEFPSVFSVISVVKSCLFSASFCGLFSGLQTAIRILLALRFSEKSAAQSFLSNCISPALFLSLGAIGFNENG
jgi:hypothetical protein